MSMLRAPFTLVYAPVVKDHVRAIGAKYYSLIRQAIETMLSYEPGIETQNRKPLKRPVTFEAGWELRCGPNNRFRVFYRVDLIGREVHILAIGEKRGERLFLSGKEVEL